MPDGGSLLEAGCGAGRFTELMVDAGAFVHAFDLSSAVEANRHNIGDQPNYRVDQIWQGLYEKATPVEELSNVPKVVRARLAEALASCDAALALKADYAEAQKVNPDGPQVPSYRCITYTSMGRFDDAIADFAVEYADQARRDHRAHAAPGARPLSHRPRAHHRQLPPSTINVVPVTYAAAGLARKAA